MADEHGSGCMGNRWPNSDAEVSGPDELLARRWKRDGNWLDELGCCKVCDGEIPDGHMDNCDIWKLEQKIMVLERTLQERQNDDKGDDRRARGLAGEGNETGTEIGRVNRAGDRRGSAGERDAGVLRPLASGDSGQGNAALVAANAALAARIRASQEEGE